MFFNCAPKKKLLLFIGDIFLILLAYFLSLAILGTFTWNRLFTWNAAFALFIYIFAFDMANLYDAKEKLGSAKYLFRFLNSIIAVFLISLLSLFVLPSLFSSRIFLFIKIGLVCVLTYLWRFLLEGVFKSHLVAQKKLVIVGAGWAGKTVFESLQNNANYKVLGFVDDDSSKWESGSPNPVLGGSPLIKDIASSDKVDVIVLAITNLKRPELLKHLVDAKMNGIEVYDMPAFYESTTGKVPVEHVNDLWFASMQISGVRKNLYNRKVKRLLDFTMSCLILIATLPLTVITAMLIKLESRGPVFFRQKRVGFNGKLFHLYKFRSMKCPKGCGEWKAYDDCNVTRVGRVIRKFRIDELPQLWNVFKGEMSLIGPRALVEDEVREFEKHVPYFSIRHSIKPGITGWAQVNYRHGNTIEDALEKIQYDLYYIKSLNLFLDFHIVLRTVKVILQRKGAK